MFGEVRAPMSLSVPAGLIGLQAPAPGVRMTLLPTTIEVPDAARREPRAPTRPRRPTTPSCGGSSAATFVVILNETIMINAIPRLMADFAVDANAAQWLSTAFMLTMAVVIPITGWFLQRVTTRFAFGLAIGVFCAGTLLAAAAWTFPVLLVARVVQAERHRGDDAAADDHPDGGRARPRPRPRDGQRHAGHVGGAGARPRRLRRDPAVAVLALDLPGRAADRRRHRGAGPAPAGQRR